jgi:hypothetical protein
MVVKYVIRCMYQRLTLMKFLEIIYTLKESKIMKITSANKIFQWLNG